MPELAVVPLAEPLEDEAPLEDECQCHSPRCARFAAILQNRLISTLETSGALCRGHVHSFSYGYLPCWSQHYSFWASLNGLGLVLAPILRSRWHNFGPLRAWTQPGLIFRRACKCPNGVNFGNIGANFNPDWVEPGPTWRRFSPAWYQSPSFPLSRFPLSFPPSPPFTAGRNAQSDSMTSRLCFEVAMGG